MKKLLIVLFVFVSLSLNAQHVTNHAKNVNNKEVDGFYYHLPRNIVRVDFVVEKNQDVKGKYSSFTRELLGTDDYIKENKTSYRIKSVNINTLTEADPNYVFFISADEKSKDNLNINLKLTSDGVIESFGYKNHDAVTSNLYSVSNALNYEDELSEYHFIPIREEDEYDEEEETSETKISEKDMALAIIEEIKNLRVAYFDLITGYQEVKYGTTINYMVDQIKNLENEYLSLFLGKNEKHTFTQTFYIIPEEGKTTITLGKFSDTEGFNQKVGELVKINFADTSIGAYVNKLSKDDIENMTHNNKIFYRNPANVTVQVIFGDSKLLENRIKISQFGNVIMIPIDKMKLTFDSNTGQIISIIKE
ncbi:MAG: DUF4831 family protein [Bacteroidales bacterium]|nr:DUF4831 family protein [Bacteroidales bacterium]